MLRAEPTRHGTELGVWSVDRRSYERERTNLRVYARAPAERACALRAVDISSDGVFLDGWQDPPAPGTELSITFVVDSGSTLKLIHRRARVARVTSAGTGLVHAARSPGSRRRPLSPWSSLRWPDVE